MSGQQNYNPYYIIRDLHNQMDSVFGDYYENERQNKREEKQVAHWAPVVEMRENENLFLISAELPGIKREDISIDLHGNTLSISGERVEKTKEKNEKIHRMERSYGKFTRTFTLPKNSDLKNISATHENGVLELSIPKLAPIQPVSKKIQITPKNSSSLSSSSSSSSSSSTSTSTTSEPVEGEPASQTENQV